MEVSTWTCFEPPFKLCAGGEDPEATKYAKSDSDSEEEEEETAAVEMILETYFMHVDNTYNKLQTLCKYSPRFMANYLPFHPA